MLYTGKFDEVFLVYGSDVHNSVPMVLYIYIWQQHAEENYTGNKQDIEIINNTTGPQ